VARCEGGGGGQPPRFHRYRMPATDRTQFHCFCSLASSNPACIFPIPGQMPHRSSRPGPLPSGHAPVRFLPSCPARAPRRSVRIRGDVHRVPRLAAPSALRPRACGSAAAGGGGGDRRLGGGLWWFWWWYLQGSQGEGFALLHQWARPGTRPPRMTRTGGPGATDLQASLCTIRNLVVMKTRSDAVLFIPQ